MVDLDLCYTSASALAELIRRKELSPVELIDNAIQRIEQVNPKLNAFCFTYFDEACEKAKEAEAAVARGDDLGPLHGLPFVIKDMTPTKGKTTTRGSRIHEHWVPDEDAAVVSRQSDAGGILIGKTTTPEYAFSWFTDSPLWGVTRNPWNLDKTPCGSSGGSAAAVASGCAPLAEGSDSGGSIRGPAAWCGLVGLKPSFGRIPFEILPSVFDQTWHFGPIVRTVDDAALFLDVTNGPHEADIQTLLEPLDIALPIDGDVRGLRLAFSPDLGYITVDPEVEANARAACDALRSAGAVVEEIALEGLPTRLDPRWLMSATYYAAVLGDKLEEWRDRMDPGFVRRIEAGLAADAVTAKGTELMRTEVWHIFRAVFERYDAFLCPTMPIPAPDVTADDEDYDHLDDEGRYIGLEMTSHFNLIGQCPALSVPTGFTGERLPTALQIVGNRYDDLMCLRIGKALEPLIGWPAWRPPV
ncbi:MAG: amidase [Proteobacteria bacterium]|nr:amidase [Pseudomonadota bacterium]